MKPLSLLVIVFILISCESKQNQMKKIIFLHHSTGQKIWIGNTNRYVYKFTKRSDVASYFKKINKKSKVRCSLEERSFPAESPYGWKNSPYDYYNIWVKNAGEKPYLNEPTLEILTKEYDIIIFKHCFPVSKILENTGIPNIDSDEKRIENYKLQYTALKNKMHQFPSNKFIVWTPAVHVKNNITSEEALRTYEFYKWVKDEWDEKGDNIYIWDFYSYETEGGLYLQDKYASGINDSHPNKQLSGKLAPLFAQFIDDLAQGVIE